MNYIEYKTVARVQLFGISDMLKNDASSVYKSTGSSFTNAKRLRFNLNGSFNNVRLSQNAKLIVESAFFPSMNHPNNTVIVRLTTGSEDNYMDTYMYNAGDPIILTCLKNTLFYNPLEILHGMRVPYNILQNGYIDIKIELPYVTSNVILSGTVLNEFFLTFIVIDEDKEQTQDPALAPAINYSDYTNKTPIKTY